MVEPVKVSEVAYSHSLCVLRGHRVKINHRLELPPSVRTYNVRKSLISVINAEYAEVSEGTVPPRPPWPQRYKQILQLDPTPPSRSIGDFNSSERVSRGATPSGASQPRPILHFSPEREHVRIDLH